MTQYTIKWKDEVSPCRFCKQLAIVVEYTTPSLENFNWLDATFSNARCTHCGKNAVTSDGN